MWFRVVSFKLAHGYSANDSNDPLRLGHDASMKVVRGTFETLAKHNSIQRCNAAMQLVRDISMVDSNGPLRWRMTCGLGDATGPLRRFHNDAMAIPTAL